MAAGGQQGHVGHVCTQESKEPEIFRAIRKGAVLENVAMDICTGVVDYGR